MRRKFCVLAVIRMTLKSAVVERSFGWRNNIQNAIFTGRFLVPSVREKGKRGAELNCLQDRA